MEEKATSGESRDLNSLGIYGSLKDVLSQWPGGLSSSSSPELTSGMTLGKLPDFSLLLLFIL